MVASAVFEGVISYFRIESRFFLKHMSHVQTFPMWAIGLRTVILKRRRYP